jgi:phenylpyruvate tautomerase PptA (4-oxalocrotonate tautomerase family)
MPVVTVELVAGANRALEDNLAQSLADAVGRVFNSPSGQTWVRLRSLGCNEYAENGSKVEAEELPVFVTVLKRHLPLDAELQAEVAALARAIAQVLHRPVDCVHVEYAPAAAGRVSFGGKLVE